MYVSQKVILPIDWDDTYADYVFTVGENVDTNSVAAVLQIFQWALLVPVSCQGCGGILKLECEYTATCYH